MSAAPMDSLMVLEAVNVVLLVLVLCTVVAIIRCRNLMVATILLSVFSVLMAAEYLLMGAPDVAMTEAAVGAGISTLLVLSAMRHTGVEEKKRIPARRYVVASVVAVFCALLLAYGLLPLPWFGALDSITHALGQEYLTRSLAETGVPNVVTSVLASYRGYDTLGETTVVFTASISVWLLLKRT